MIIFQLADMIWSQKEQRYKLAAVGLGKLKKMTVSDWHDCTSEVYYNIGQIIFLKCTTFE
ncbi:MAG: hypothetical protein HXX14_07090 [Bacteroidetes bacterium]|nr:hypothetical protein [Bacteroidota bacterium]